MSPVSFYMPFITFPGLKENLSMSADKRDRPKGPTFHERVSSEKLVSNFTVSSAQ